MVRRFVDVLSRFASLCDFAHLKVFQEQVVSEVARPLLAIATDAVLESTQSLISSGAVCPSNSRGLLRLCLLSLESVRGEALFSTVESAIALSGHCYLDYVDDTPKPIPGALSAALLSCLCSGGEENSRNVQMHVVHLGAKHRGDLSSDVAKQVFEKFAIGLPSLEMTKVRPELSA